MPDRREESLSEIVDVAVDVATSFIAENAPAHIFLHAGAVAVGDRALLLPGRTRAGKSTLVAALVARGATYFSDEYAPLTEDNRVAAFPRTLSLRPGTPVGTPDIKERQSGPTRVAAVFLTSYETSGRWRPDAVSPAEAVLRMTEHAVAARSSPSRVLQRLASVADSAVVLASPRGEINESADAILATFAAIVS